jgi:hypothetical protein
MKTTIIAAITLLIGFVIGTIYGWRTGVIDGQILGSSLPVHLIQIYGQARTTNDIQARDRAVDALAMGMGVNLAVNNEFSPMALFIQPKADGGLLDIAACWQLDHPNGDGSLFPADSPSDKRLDEVMTKYKSYYERTLQEQTDKRDKTKDSVK